MTAPAPPDKGRPGWLLALVVLATGTGLCGATFSLIPLMFAPMAFDAGESVAAWAVFIGFFLMPFVPLIGIALGWIGYGMGAIKLALFGIVLTTVPIAAAWILLND
jgi:hypothetical protein